MQAAYTRNIYNYRHVNDLILPFVDRSAFCMDMHHKLTNPAVMTAVVKLLGTNNLNQIMTDVIYYANTARTYKNIPHYKKPRLWNAYCITYWELNIIQAATVDKWGYVKYKDIGYEPVLITTQEQAYVHSYNISNSDPSQSQGIYVNTENIYVDEQDNNIPTHMQNL